MAVKLLIAIFGIDVSYCRRRTADIIVIQL